MGDQTDGQARPSIPWGADPAGADRAEWIELAVEAGFESLKAQREDLSGMRTRAVAFAALTVAASAFLVGAGLSPNVTRADGFYTWAGFGTAGFVLIAVSLIMTVAPFRKFEFILDPDKLIAWMDGPSPAPSRQVAMRILATKQLPGMIKRNDSKLTFLKVFYTGLLVFGIATLALWISVVWIFS